MTDGRTLGIISILGGGLFLIISIICFIVALKKSKSLKNVKEAKISTIIIFISSLILCIAFSNRCMCGYPTLGFQAFYVVGLSFVVNWLILFSMLKKDQGNYLKTIIIIVIVEAILIIGLELLFPENYHENTIKFD